MGAAIVRQGLRVGCMYVYVCMCMYVYVYVCMCMYMYGGAHREARPEGRVEGEGTEAGWEWWGWRGGWRVAGW